MAKCCISLLHSKNTRVKLDPEKRSIGAKLYSESTMTRKSVNLTRNMTESWVNLTTLYVKSAESWPHSGSLLTRKGVWPQWTLFRVTLTRMFLECYFALYNYFGWIRERVINRKNHNSHSTRINDRKAGNRLYANANKSINDKLLIIIKFLILMSALTQTLILTIKALLEKYFIC